MNLTLNSFVFVEYQFSQLLLVPLNNKFELHLVTKDLDNNSTLSY